MHGQCLCGQVSFELLGDAPRLYQCHCSLCRKQGGSASNTATIVAADRLRWLAGVDLIRSWVKDSGFRSDFCSNCGSPLPNPLRDLPYVWIPAGLLEFNAFNALDAGLTVVAQLHVASKAAWDVVDAATPSFATMPEFAELLDLLHAR